MVKPGAWPPEPRRDYRNGYYERDFVTCFGPYDYGLPEAASWVFRPRCCRRSGCEPVSSQTVSRLSRDLDKAARQFHQAPLQDEWAYLFLDGVSLRFGSSICRRRVAPVSGEL